MNQVDYSEAVRWWRKAAEQGDAQSQKSLGWAYSSGLGVEKNAAEGEKWFSQACRNGIRNACQ